MVVLQMFFLILVSSNNISPLIASEVTEIDLLVNGIEENYSVYQRHFSGILPPVQGPGIRSWEVILYEETISEVVDEILFMDEKILQIDCIYYHSGFQIISTYYYNQADEVVLCSSTWSYRSDGIPLYFDKFYYSGSQVIACSSDDGSLTPPSAADIEKGNSRLRYADHIIEDVISCSAGSPPVFIEQIEYVYENF